MRSTSRPPRWLAALDRAVLTVSRLLAALAALALLLTMLAVTADVARRSTSGEAIAGVTEYSEIGLVLTVFLGLAYGQRQRTHVSVDIAIRRLPPRLAQVLVTIGELMLAALLLWLVAETVPVAVESIQEGEYRFGLARVPVWPARLAIPLGAAALLAEVLLDIMRRLAGAEQPQAHAVDGGL